jgi:hypothetical protein
VNILLDLTLREADMLFVPEKNVVLENRRLLLNVLEPE